MRKLLLACLIGIVAGPMASLAVADDTEKAASKKKVTLASFDIKGGFPETTGSLGLFGELEQNLLQTIQRLDQAAQSDKVEGIVLRIRNPIVGRGKVNELRTAIARARKSGKKVYAELQMGLAADYLIACSCDEIVMPASGALIIPGVRAEMMFYKGLLEKVGVKADILQMGDFKGAGEPYTRDKMSPELRKQYESLLDDVYDQMVSTIAKDRKLKPERVRKLIDQGVFSAKAAKKAGLIDRIAYEDELKTTIREEKKADSLSLIRNFGKKKVDTDFSGFGGMMKLMNIMMGNEPGKISSRDDKIALIYAVGVIMTGSSQSDILGNSTLGSETIVKALRKASKDKTVKAIVLRVDSPGGSATASDLIWREVERIEKPIIASMGDVAASGGYYISMGADQIFAEPGTLTGSIGVVGGKMAVGGLLDKVGITTDVITRGKNSGVFSLSDPFSDSEREAMKNLMKETYEQFTTKAAKGRKMKIERLEKLAQGKVYTGRQAKENGLVDECGTLRDAITAAKKAAGMDPEKKAELLILPKPKSIFEQMFGGATIESRATAASVSQLVPELARPIAEANTLRQLFAEPVNVILPVRVQIK